MDVVATKYQVMPDLTPIEYEALKADIAERGVLVPVEVDESGAVLDGHHRIRAWHELCGEGVELPDYPRMIRTGLTEEQKRNHARSLNVLRRHLSKDQRDEVMRDMRRDGMSYRQIADAVGVDPATAYHKTSGVEISTPVAGRDGKQYPARHERRAEAPAPIPGLFAPSGSTQGGMLDILQKVQGTAPDLYDAARSGDISIKEAKREMKRRDKQAERKETTVTVDDPGVWHGDMRELGRRIADNSVDLILTDPPYPGEFLPLFSDLSTLAARVLKPGGLCLVYSGQIFLPEVISRLSESLEYVWTFAIRHGGGNQRIFKMNVNTGWKPVLAFYKPPLSVWWDSFIDITSGTREKDLHEWQQAESEAAYFIEHLSLPGQVVVDPFCGSGTVLSAAKKLGRQYLGIEAAEEHVQHARERLA